MDVAWLKKKIPDSNDPVINEKLGNMLDVIDEAVKFVRKLAAELRPSILDDLGLVPALEWHSQEFEKRFNIRIEFLTDAQELHTTSVIATGLFRMYQESLTNVARHSNATKVVVSLRLINDEIRLSIMDNGRGFDSSMMSKKTLGLLGMKERAAMLGGKLEIKSEPGRGTTVLITVRQPQMEKVAAF
jgi:signal transduction histidine kinase